ncbi:MAG: serine/threonine protein kinase [Actinomycetota bacterium]|nr:serine/threonine protein kinase [Actinomycetota bacterium]
MIEPLATFGEFQLVRQLGQPGGFGAAYDAVRHGERCVVKIFHDELIDRVALARFQREVMAQRRCSHPNLVRYLDSGLTSWQGRRCHWISMPYLEGRTLRDELAIRGGSISAEHAIAVSRQVAAGLIALHDEGIVHRDLKPSNIFLCDDGRVIILDFGIALFLDYTSLTERGAFIGTYGYAAPEQLEGEEVPATDLYSLGAVLYHLITGRVPFRARGHLELINRIRFENPEPPSSFAEDVPVSLEQLILLLLEKEPHSRPVSARKLTELLDECEVGQPVLRLTAYARDARPLLFLRTGRERGPLGTACAAAAKPSGVIAPLVDHSARKEARLVAGHCDIYFSADPQFFRFAHASFTASRRLTEVSFAPSDKITPFQPDHFRNLDHARETAAAVVDDQIEAGANFLFGASCTVRSIDDKWLPRSAKLLEESVRHRDYRNSELPLFAQLVLSLDGFCSAEAQARLANQLSRADVDGYFLLLDQLAPESAPGLLVAAIRLALVLQQTGRPVVLGRADVLGYLFLAFGIAGIERGLGRALGFRLADFEKRTPIAMRPPRFEIPSLLASFTPEQAEGILTSGLVPESSCPCPACKSATSIRQRLSRTIEHDAAMYEQLRDELDGVDPRLRVARLSTAIESARSLEAQLVKAKLLGSRLQHLRDWPHAIAAARRFLEVDALRRAA